MSQAGKVEHLHPEGLHDNPAFSNVVTVSGPVKTIYVGGQNAVDAGGEVVGKGDLGAQARQIFKNLETALRAAGAKIEDVIKWSIVVVEGQPLQPAFEVFQQVWGRRPNPPLISVAFVSSLANPDFLAELEAIAVIPE
jgi:enamine deaminase RidA (YjgF/YER057c/UK114 family)